MFTLRGAYFYTAGLFARFLVERHGLEGLVDFLRSTEKYDSFAQFPPVFEDVFGESIDAAASEFESYPSPVRSCSPSHDRIGRPRGCRRAARRRVKLVTHVQLDPHSRTVESSGI